MLRTGKILMMCVLNVAVYLCECGSC